MTILTDDSNYKAIANAIRTKNGTEETYKPSEMASAIETIPSGGLRFVKGNSGCGLQYNNGVMTITGIEVNKLKRLVLYRIENINQYEQNKLYFDFDFDISSGKYDCRYVTNAISSALVYIDTNQNAMITLDETNNIITINPNLTDAAIMSGAVGSSGGWFYKAFYEL